MNSSQCSGFIADPVCGYTGHSTGDVFLRHQREIGGRLLCVEHLQKFNNRNTMRIQRRNTSGDLAGGAIEANGGV